MSKDNENWKPCLFCGGKATLINLDNDYRYDDVFKFVCTKCRVSTRETSERDLAILLWEGRTNDE